MKSGVGRILISVIFSVFGCACTLFICTETEWSTKQAKKKGIFISVMMNSNKETQVYETLKQEK